MAKDNFNFESISESIFKIHQRSLIPRAVTTLGKELFLEVPLYAAKEPYQVLYVNRDLFKQIFPESCVNGDLTFQLMAAVISTYFSTTLDSEKSTGKQIAQAYIDYQADPLNISLNDNLGSGRAFYQFDIFNIKGEKTPLATSHRPEYSNGVLELEKAMFETIASNSLYQDTHIQLSPILAILDMGELCRVPWKNTVCKRAKIIRLDLDGSLNRITHLFQSQTPLSKNDLIGMAQKMGIQEGEKFLHRIEHGAWSAGNISQQGHMIDFDTVCGVKFRAPQYSFSKWFMDNYFGQEYLGALKILKSLVKSPVMNPEDVSYGVLKKELLATRKHHIEQGFVALMGFETLPEFVRLKIRPSLKKVVKQWMFLSTRCYPVPSDLELKFLNCLTCAPFDFSHFFRLYPILRRSPDWSLACGMEHLVTCVKEFSDFDWNAICPQDKNEAFFKRTVVKKLDKYFIHSREELVELSLACVEFIQWYDLLFQKIQALLHTDGSHDPGAVEAHAYCINQDRLHLFMPYSMAGPLDDEKNELSPEEMSQRIEMAILSNRRSQIILDERFKYSNMALFKEGYLATLHNEQHQHQLRLTVFKSQCPSLLKEILDLERIPLNDEDFVALFEVSVNHQRFPCSVVESCEGEISLQSPWRDNLDLIPPEYTEITFYFKNTPIIFQNIQFSFTQISHTQNFASGLYPLWEG